ncbi:MAG: class II fructose-bisphosphate aldolase [Chloroflexi bacterium]|nr:class II fructose-bisphosphate aldolase [Chloroflexota bacterium]MDA1146275.1 class II fructose-bisphosphate aldolase [Chloroflexota bacterium]
MSTLKPGVVTSQDYRTLVSAAKQGGYAIPAVNIVGTDSINAVMEAAAQVGSDVIVQLSNGGAQFFAGQGLPDKNLARVMGAVSAAQHADLLAKHYGVCVVMHTDHANRGLVPWVEGVLTESEAHHAATGRPLFTSHMLDLSEETVEFNLQESARLLRRMAAIDVSLEIELGITGGEEDGVGSDEDTADNPRLYSQPQDVLDAYELLTPIGHVAIAAAFGNVHGVYKPGNVHLRPHILGDAQALVASKVGGTNPVDLVFHGGSGSEDGDIREALSHGVFKMNIDTDTQFAFAEAIGKYVLQSPRAFQYQIDPDTDQPYKNLYDPRKWLREGELGMVARLQESFDILGSRGKSLARS